MTDKTENIQKQTEANCYALPKKNLIMLAIGFIIVVIGFCLMIGGDGGTKFNPEIFNFRRITLGPIVAMTGFIIDGVAILWIKKQ